MRRLNGCADVDRLWFPVKHLLVIALTLLVSSCGYRPVLGSTPPSERLSVVAAPGRVPNAEALAGVLSALKEELRAAGALKAGTGYPRLVVEVMRVSETAGGLTSASGSRPIARSVAIAVTARAWVKEGEGAERTALDTGDIRRTSQIAPADQAAVDAEGYLEAAFEAGRRTGVALARRVLGVPEPGYGPL